MTAPFAEHVFVVQTLEPRILSDCLKARCYGITTRAFMDHLPPELRNVPAGSAAFIRLKSDPQSFLLGPLFTEPAPPELKTSGHQGIWSVLDPDNKPSARLPAFHDRFPCCFFFRPIEDQRFGILTDAELQEADIHLPPWGLLPGGLGRKLIAMSSGRRQEALSALESLGFQSDAPPPTGIALTLPPHLQEVVRLSPDVCAPTGDALKKILGQARRIVKIFSPYIDATFINLIHDVTVPVQVITTPHKHRTWKPNPVLERLATNQSLQVRYLAEASKGAHLFQLHAKMVLSDQDIAYIGSANLTDTSVFYNIELGLTTTDAAILATLDRLFDFLFANVAVRAENLSRPR